MRTDIGETEDEFRVKATVATGKLLQLLLKHHGDNGDNEENEDDDPPELQRSTVEAIQNAVAASYGVTRAEMLSERRNIKIIMPRHVAMYLCRELTPRSLPAIGRMFGRDHTSIHSANEKITRLITSDPVLAAKIETIRAGFEQ